MSSSFEKMADCFHCLAMANGLMTAKERKTKNVASQTTMGHKGNEAGMKAKRRAKAHSENSANNGIPFKVWIPVQFMTAVNRKPATTAMVNPKTISWPCQTVNGMATKILAPME